MTKSTKVWHSIAAFRNLIDDVVAGTDPSRTAVDISQGHAEHASPGAEEELSSTDEDLKPVLASTEVDESTTHTVIPNLVLHTAVMINDIISVQTLLSSLDLDLNGQDEDGWTALHWACLEGHSELSHMLISDLRTDLDAVDKVCLFLGFLFIT